MSDETPAPKSGKAPKAEAVETPAAAETPAEVRADESAEAPSVEPTPAETTAPEPAPEPAPADSEPASEAPRAASDQQVVYVQTPVPPRARGNRVVGVLLAILGAIIFAVVYSVVAALIIDLRSGDLFGPRFGGFLGNAYFWVPGLLFLVGLVLLVLILNRAGWWTHVLGSLVLAVAVYFGMIGVLLLIANVFHGTTQPLTFAGLTVDPFVLAAALVAREVSIWIGLAIAARGRRVKVRNVETRTAWDREQEEKKAEYERTAASAA
jgi:hypothetical protein